MARYALGGASLKACRQAKRDDFSLAGYRIYVQQGFRTRQAQAVTAFEKKSLNPTFLQDQGVFPRRWKWLVFSFANSFSFNIRPPVKALCSMRQEVHCHATSRQTTASRAW